MTMKLVLIRHGESLWNKENLFTGWTDVDLSETGRKEASEAGKVLKAEGFDFVRFSPLNISLLGTVLFNNVERCLFMNAR